MDVIEVSELQVEFDMVFEKLTMLEKLLYKKDELSEKQQGHLIEERSAIYF